MDELSLEINRLPGPILIVGASGFVGANLMRMIAARRSDVYGTQYHSTWRLTDIAASQLLTVDLTTEENICMLLDRVQPMTVFDCMTYGGYSFEEDMTRIYQVNLTSKILLIHQLLSRRIYCYVHAGSSSEYGFHAQAPKEITMTTPNSHYAVAKCAIANLLYHLGQHQGFRCANLRLYSVYGPFEEASRLIPTLVREGLKGHLPPFVNADTSRDFIYVDDVCKAFIAAANYLPKTAYGESFNIGTGQKTTIREVAFLAKELYSIKNDPHFSSFTARSWDTNEWYANPEKAHTVLQWRAETNLKEGLQKTTAWFSKLSYREDYLQQSKQNKRISQNSVSAIVACYKDAKAIPIMAERLIAVFEKCAIDYEIILVNDGSPDDSESVIQQLSLHHARIIGITHARNFGSQAAFRSGMRMASKEACVLLDGDLQDPPELIPQFIERWRQGFDVVYGVRVKREAPWLMQVAYKLFYRLFNWMSSVPIPCDAGDFSLMDKRVVKWILACPERDLYLRGLRAYVGFKQTGIPYTRPERLFGKSTNNLFKNMGWAKKGIFSFSKVPLNIMTTSGVLFTVFTVLLAIYQICTRLFFPHATPKGVTTLMLLIMFFGSITLFSVSILGEYIAKIFEEVKARPHYVRKHIIKNGVIHFCDNDDKTT